MNQNDPSDLPHPAEETASQSTPDGNASASHSLRLQRFLAQCGLGARRECEALVTSGRITVDGKTVNELGTKVDPKKHDIRLDGERLKPQSKQTFVFNKPPGVLCTMKDPQHRPRVVDFFPAAGPRLFTVGRLDESSTGLIIVTNDGDLAQQLAHPKYRIYRTYNVQVAGIPGRDALTAVKQGLWFAEGKFRVQSAKVLKRQGRSTILEVVLREGQNREVRRLFDKVGHKVMKLKRVAFGPVRLGSLTMGKFRPMSKDELAALRHIIDRNQQPPAEESANERPRRPQRGKRQHGGKRPQRPSRRPTTRRTSDAFEAADDTDRPRRRGPHPASGRRRQEEQGEGRQYRERRPSEGRRYSEGSTEGGPASRRRTGGRPEGEKRRSRGASDRREGQKRAGQKFKSEGEAQGQRPFRPRRPGKPRPQGKPKRPGRDRRPGRDDRG